jgi:ribosomal protein S17E
MSGPFIYTHNTVQAAILSNYDTEWVKEDIAGYVTDPTQRLTATVESFKQLKTSPERAWEL